MYINRGGHGQCFVSTDPETGRKSVTKVVQLVRDHK